MIYLGADHRGYYLKENIKDFLDSKKIEYQDLGNFTFEETDDYPDFAKLVATKVSQKPATNVGILICGSGQGMCITANKYPKIRAALCLSSWMAQQAREHDNSNVLCLAGDLTDPQTAFRIVDTFLNTKPSLNKNYQRRLNKITQIEKEIFKNIK